MNWLINAAVTVARVATAVNQVVRQQTGQGIVGHVQSWLQNSSQPATRTTPSSNNSSHSSRGGTARGGTARPVSTTANNRNRQEQNRRRTGPDFEEYSPPDEETRAAWNEFFGDVEELFIPPHVKEGMRDFYTAITGQYIGEDASVVDRVRDLFLSAAQTNHIPATASENAFLFSTPIQSMGPSAVTTNEANPITLNADALNLVSEHERLGLEVTNDLLYGFSINRTDDFDLIYGQPYTPEQIEQILRDDLVEASDLNSDNASNITTLDLLYYRQQQIQREQARVKAAGEQLFNQYQGFGAPHYLENSPQWGNLMAQGADLNTELAYVQSIIDTVPVYQDINKLMAWFEADNEEELHEVLMYQLNLVDGVQNPQQVNRDHPDWVNPDTVALATELVDSYREQLAESDENYPYGFQPYDAQRDYNLGSLETLTRTDYPPDLTLLLFAIRFWDLADYVITPIEIAKNLTSENPDWDRAGRDVIAMLVPGIHGGMDDAARAAQRQTLINLRFTDEIADGMLDGRYTMPSLSPNANAIPTGTSSSQIHSGELSALHDLLNQAQSQGNLADATRFQNQINALLMEDQVALSLRRNYGYNVHQNPASSTGYPVAELIIEGRRGDLYTPNLGTNIKTVIQSINTHSIDKNLEIMVVSVDTWGGNIEDVTIQMDSWWYEQIARNQSGSSSTQSIPLREVIFMQDGMIIDIWLPPLS